VVGHRVLERLKETGRVHHSHWVAVVAQPEVEELVEMRRDGNEHILVKRELLLDVGKQRVDLVRVCVVQGRSDGHGELARERVRAEIYYIPEGGPYNSTVRSKKENTRRKGAL
jgi:hypothetical protein